MGKGCNTLAGKVKATGNMYVKAEYEGGSNVKPKVTKGGDLRAKDGSK